jgi:RND superfamily putative drug exporter
VLVAGALGALGGREPLSFADSFRDPPPSVEAQDVIAEHFIPGRVAPVGVVTDFGAAPGVVGALSADPRVPIEEMYVGARSVPAPGREDLALSEAYLSLDPFSQAATDSVPAIRAAARAAAEGRAALVGGEVAEAYDTQQALARDTRLIVPVTLALILLILAGLLRAVVMPLYVIGTVILSFAFALGASSLLFTHVLDQPASDPSLALFSFIFLVALGVDYNVFLLARIREEREHLGTKAAVAAALERTGGIITSAGLVLAATFAVLMALELEALFQVGFVVALGLLADTFLVRALLVPAIAILLGDRNWWPHRF